MSATPGYETRDANVGRLVLIAALLAVVVAGVLLAVPAFLASLEREAAERDAGVHPLAVDGPPPGPRLQANPAEELAEHRALELRRTSEYAWVDAERGIVRIPVERAVELIVERGVPPRTEKQGEVR